MDEVELSAYLTRRLMYRRPVLHTSENELFLKLFITNGGGW